VQLKKVSKRLAMLTTHVLLEAHRREPLVLDLGLGRSFWSASELWRCTYLGGRDKYCS
jgi:hypothetical protein